MRAPLWVRGNLVILFCHCERNDAAISVFLYVIRSTFLSFPRFSLSFPRRRESIFCISFCIFFLPLSLQTFEESTAISLFLYIFHLLLSLRAPLWVRVGCVAISYNVIASPVLSGRGNLILLYIPIFPLFSTQKL